MINKRCISIKNKIIHYMVNAFPDFQFKDSTSQFYVFTRENNDSIYDYIIIQKEFYQGKINLTISEIASCYNKSWKGIPHSLMGYDTNIGCLITDKKYYDSSIGWYSCENDEKSLIKIFEYLKRDINFYVIDFFKMAHKKINNDYYMKSTSSYIKSQFSLLNQNDIDSIKYYLIDVNKSYCKYNKNINNKYKSDNYFNIIPINPIIKHWIENITNIINDNFGIERIDESKLIKYITILFKDNYDFYNLR